VTKELLPFANSREVHASHDGDATASEKVTVRNIHYGSCMNREKEHKMKNADDLLAAVFVAALLILTAWGNAIVMFAVSAIGWVAGLLFFGNRARSGGLLVAVVGFAVGAAIAIAIRLKRSY